MLALTKPEARLLRECEATIERGLATFVEVGQALLAIRDERLYRERHKTFEDYCQERWGWKRAHAYRQIEAAQVVRNLSPMGDTPTNERQARVLAPLTTDRQRELWGKALENGKVTARDLTELIQAEAEAKGIQLRKDSRETEEERLRHAEWKQEAERNSEHNFHMFQFIHAIEVLSEPRFPLEEVAQYIRKFDTPDKNWCGRAPQAAGNLGQLAKEMNT